MEITLLTLTISQLFILVIYLMYLIHRYASKHVPNYVKLICLSAWLLSFGLVIVLPLNVYDTLQGDDDKMDSGIDQLWKSLYWISFILSWTFLPISQEYENAGEFTFKQKIQRSLKNNLIMYAISAVIGLVFVIYLLTHGQLSFQAVLAVFVVLSNGFGFILIAILLGYGLVAIPQNYFRERDDYVRCNKLYHSINISNNKVKNLNNDLEDLASDIIQVKNKYRNNEKLAQYFEIVVNHIPDNILTQSENSKSRTTTDLDPQNECNVEMLAVWNKKVKEMVREIARNEFSRYQSCQKALFIEDTIECKNIVGITAITSNVNPARESAIGKILDWVVWLWYCRMRSYMVIVLGGLFSVLSCLVLISQVFIFTPRQLSPFGQMFEKDDSFIVVQILCLIPLGYILYCLQYGLLSIKVSGLYGLYDNQHTDGPSLLFAATFITRVSFPLAFNFLWMVKIDDELVTDVVGSFDQNAYWVTFKFILPILLLVLTIFNLFNVYDRILKTVGISSFQFQADYTDDNIEDGRKLVKEERDKIESDNYNQRMSNVTEIRQPLNTSQY